MSTITGEEPTAPDEDKSAFVDEDETVFRQSSAEDVESTEEEIFHDAQERFPRETATAPSVDHSSAKREEDIDNSELMPRYTRRYFPNIYTPPRYSVAVQTDPQEGKPQPPGPIQHRADSKDDLNGTFMTGPFSNDGDRFFDAGDVICDDGDGTIELLHGDKRHRKNGSCTSKRSPISCPGKGGCGSGSETSSRWGRTAGASQANQDDPETCCQCLLVVVYWLAVCLFLSLLLSVFMVIFLLFSRNHGLGIGPSLLYADVDVIRTHINPYMDLRHNGPPPT